MQNTFLSEIFWMQLHAAKAVAPPDTVKMSDVPPAPAVTDLVTTLCPSNALATQRHKPRQLAPAQS
jgi:hypothetical protein